jgi:3-deoxy-D-arabino-heptulosonate 7-phosphate (DAHP) synthase
MRVNIYAEEMTDKVEVISKEIEGQIFTGLRLYLELPATVDGKQYQGPFMHSPDDNDSAAVTFWGKRDLRTVLKLMLEKLNEHYAKPRTPKSNE